MDAKQGIDWLIERLRAEQSSDGSWDYPFDTGISTDAYMIILLNKENLQIISLTFHHL